MGSLHLQLEAMSHGKVVEASYASHEGGPCKDMPQNQEDYVCLLSEEVALVAKKELREEENIRTQTLKQFREWIQQNGDLENCRTDANFLLRFLRVKKYSLPMAQQLLLKYINFRQTFRHHFFELDFLNPTVNKLISDGYTFASPFRDRSGRRVTIMITSKLNPTIYKNVDMAKVHMITYEACMMDEDTQVLGLTHFADVGHSHAAQFTIWSPTEIATIIKWGEQSLPLRHKEEHIINISSGFRFIVDFAFGRLSEKMRSRLKIHDSLEELHKHLGPKVLPKEYGGVMPMKEMIDLWKAELLRKRETLLALDSIKLLSDRNIITRKNRETNNDFQINGGVSSISGSFRKLELD